MLRSTTFCWNSAHVATRRFHNLDWYSIHALLQHAPDAVIYRVEVRTVCWPATRTDELGCLTAQKLDSVMSTMCWRTVLLEDKHVSSNAADSLVAASAVLRQQHVSLMFAACAKMSLVQPSVDTVRLTTACVSSTNLRYGRVLEASCCDMGWISHRVVEHNITCCQVKKSAFYKVVHWHFSGVMGKG